MNWGPGDYVLAAAVLIAAALSWKFARSNVSGTRGRVIAGLLILAGLVLLWAEFAVGVFGTPGGGS